MRFTPHEYQKRAIKWVETHPRCLLFLDMGLGKTVVTLTVIQGMVDHGETGKVLVVAPKKVAEGTWSSEVGRWDHLSLTVSVVTGTPAQRRKALDEKADIYVIGRDSVAWLAAEPTSRRRYDMVVLDELTSFKNHRSRRFRSLQSIVRVAERVVGLTGTPTPNGLLDLWAQVYCVDGGVRLGMFYTKYRQKYFNCVEHNHIVIRATPRPGSEAQILKNLSDIALTMRAEDYLDLPRLIENDVAVALPAKVMAGYRDFERERVMELKDSEITAGSAAALASKLGQYANGAVYGDGGVLFAEVHDEKLEALGEILESVGGPVLCFYQYRHDLTRIMNRFAGLDPREYGGQQDLDDWNAGKVRLLLAHPASTAFGLNMQQGGNVIVWFSTGWNLEHYLQANARLHRQGQTRPVIVHRLIAAGTIDERMAAAISGKGEGQARFLDGMKTFVEEYLKRKK